MGLEEKLPSGLLLTTVEKMGGYAQTRAAHPYQIDHPGLAAS